MTSRPRPVNATPAQRVAQARRVLRAARGVAGAAKSVTRAQESRGRSSRPGLLATVAACVAGALQRQDAGHGRGMKFANCKRDLAGFSEISGMTGIGGTSGIPRGTRRPRRTTVATSTPSGFPTSPHSFISLKRRALTPFDRALRARGRATLRAIRRGAQSRAPDLRSGPLVATTTPSEIPTSPHSFISLKRRALTPFDRALCARGRATLRAIRRGAQSRRPGPKSR